MDSDDPILKRKIRFRPELTLGTLIQVAVTIFLAGGVYYTTRNDIDTFKGEMRSMRAAVEEQQRETKALSIQQARMETMLADDRDNRHKLMRPKDANN